MIATLTTFICIVAVFAVIAYFADGAADRERRTIDRLVLGPVRAERYESFDRFADLGGIEAEQFEGPRRYTRPTDRQVSPRRANAEGSTTNPQNASQRKGE